MTVVNANRSSHPEDIKPTARGNRLHSVYYLVVEAELAAMCTCCSDLPVVRQPVLIYPFIPLNYVFNAPPSWHPKMMPAVNLQMPGLSVNPMNISMNVGMSGPAMNVNINPSSPYHQGTNVAVGGMGVGVSLEMHPL